MRLRQRYCQLQFAVWQIQYHCWRCEVLPVVHAMLVCVVWVAALFSGLVNGAYRVKCESTALVVYWYSNLSVFGVHANCAPIAVKNCFRADLGQLINAD